jgi:hypothetical protein
VPTAQERGKIMNRITFETAKQFETQTKKNGKQTAEQMEEFRRTLAKLKYYNAILKSDN